MWCVTTMLSLRLLRLEALSPAMIYLYLLGLFHLGLVVPWALGAAVSPPPLWLVTHDLRPALTLVLVALTAYQAGAAVAVWLWPTPSTCSAPSIGCYNDTLCRLGLAVMGLGLLAFCGGVYTLGLDRLLQAGYAETYELVSQYDPRLFGISLTLAPIGLYLAAAACRRRMLPWVLGAGALWSGMILFLGFRGYALIPAATVVAVLHKRGFRLSRTACGVALAALLVLIPLVRTARANSLGARGASAALPLGAPQLSVALVSAPLQALEEMGGSLRAVVHTVEFLENEPLRWGGTYWQALLAAAPNVALDWQGETYLPVEQLPPSHWVTLQAEPATYHAHGGLGFSAIAEPYMNFGVAGVAVYFFLLALALVAFYRFDLARPTRLALWAALLGPLLWTVRNDFHGFFRPALLGLATVAAALLLANSRVARRRRVLPLSTPAAAVSLRAPHGAAR
jgi:hypothetical protein